MATRHGRSKFSSRIRYEPLEPRVTPAAVGVIALGDGITPTALPGGMPDGYYLNHLLLTDGPYQARAAWAPARVHVGAFESSFVFRLDGEPGRPGDGFTFALTGTRPSDPGTAGAGLGYAGLTDSVAVKFDLVDNGGEGADSVGVFTGGAEPTTPAVTLDGSPVSLHSQHPIRADITYDGAILTLTLTDTWDRDRSVTNRFAVDIPAAVGGPTAFVGFTAGTGELFARQSIYSWTFAEVVPDAPASRPPAITTPAAATPVSQDLTVALTVGAADDGGPDGLTYTWEAVSAPAPPLITAQAVDPAAATAALYADGTYTFRVTVRDADGQTATSEVSYANQAGISRLEVSPRQATVPAGGTAQFTAVAYDPAGRPVPAPAPVTWRVAQGPGTIDSTGLYTAPANEGGAVTVHAELRVPIAPDAVRILSDEVAARVEYTPPDNRPPEIPDPIAVGFFSPSSVAFTARATDDGGAAALTYAWEVVSAPAGSAPRLTPWQPTPSVAIFTPDHQGHFVVRVTATDAQGLAATRTVGYDPPVTILDLHSPPTSLPVPGTIVFPQEATVSPGGTVQFGVDLRDPAGNRLPDPAPLWRVVYGPGTIDASGRYTAPPDAPGTAWIEATVPDPNRPPAEWPRYQAHAFILPPRTLGPGVDLGTGFAGAELSRNGSAAVAGDRLRLADAPFQAGSAFAPTPVDVRGFATSFEFQVGDTADGRWGDGLTFVLQNAGPNAVGAAGGGLGYQGLTDSVAVKFDLVDNAGEGVDSVGVFTGGAGPTAPAVSLDGTGLQLHSGHVFRADLTYGAGTLALDLRDTVTGQQFTTAFPVDVPAAVGGPTAYAGFTAGTGELFAPVDVLGWTYAPTPYATGNTPPSFVDEGIPPTETVRGRYTIFNALAQDDGGPFNLWYTWEAVSAPAGAAPVRFETSGINSGHSFDPVWHSMATFDRAGEYTFRLTVRDQQGEAAQTDPFRVVVAQEPWDFVVTPAAPTVPGGGTVGVTVEGLDQFGDPLVGTTGGWHFVLEGPGSIDDANQYHAPADWTGVVTIRATNGTATGVTVVNVVRPAGT